MPAAVSRSPPRSKPSSSDCRSKSTAANVMSLGNRDAGLRAVARASTPVWRDDPPRRRAARRIATDCGKRTCLAPRRAPRIGERRVSTAPEQADPRHSGCARREMRATLASRAVRASARCSDSPSAMATASGSSKTLGSSRSWCAARRMAHALGGPAGCGVVHGPECIIPIYRRLVLRRVCG